MEYTEGVAEIEHVPGTAVNVEVIDAKVGFGDDVESLDKHTARAKTVAVPPGTGV